MHRIFAGIYACEYIVISRDNPVDTVTGYLEGVYEYGVKLGH